MTYRARPDLSVGRELVPDLKRDRQSSVGEASSYTEDRRDAHPANLEEETLQVRVLLGRDAQKADVVVGDASGVVFVVLECVWKNIRTSGTMRVYIGIGVNGDVPLANRISVVPVSRMPAEGRRTSWVP